MDNKKELVAKIEEKEAQLQRAVQESNAWNKGKYKTSSNAEVSKIYVDTLRKEISGLREQLALMES